MLALFPNHIASYARSAHRCAMRLREVWSMADWTNSSGSFMPPSRTPFGAPQIKFFQESTAASTAACNVGDLVRNNTIVTTGGFRVRRDASTAGGGDHPAHMP